MFGFSPSEQVYLWSHKNRSLQTVFIGTYIADMPSLHPDPGFEYYFKACRKGDATAKAIAVGDSAVRVLADASKITGLPRDNFEVWEISREEFEKFRPV